MAAPSSALRAIDANLNRASEALRTLEDIARFALDDAGLTERTKRARHRLTELLGTLPLPAGLRITVRDTPGDVGTDFDHRAGARAHGCVVQAR